MYKIIIRPILFFFNPETIHNLVFIFLKIGTRIPGFKFLLKKLFFFKSQVIEKELFGLKFQNFVGLAAGLDKDAEAFEMLGCLGFSFIEIGTVTPRPQPGNTKPRLFRLKKNQALINRMGFNNLGVEHSVNKLKQNRSNIIIGGNIGKNKITPNEDAITDYEFCFNSLFDYVDYFVVNVSSPNTPNLRELQEKEPLKKLLSRLKELNLTKAKQKPILLKIAPDLTTEQLDDIIEIFFETKIDGIVATNTTISRENIDYTNKEIEKFGAGGLSGKPLKNRSTSIIKYLSEKSNRLIPIIGVGGIYTAEDAIEKLEAGASLVQIYTSFIYEGPAVMKRINKKIEKYLKKKQEN
jgi:dihydroorotate dehydrogenase